MSAATIGRVQRPNSNPYFTFQSGPQEGAITVEGSTDLPNKAKQLVFTDFHPVFENSGPDAIRPQGREGRVTFPVHTPGDIARLRIHTFYRARDARDAWDVQVPFDGGKTFRSIDRLTGPYVMMGKASAATDVPRGGFRPVKATCVWDENGAEKRHEHIAAKPAETYTIQCAAQPVMKSLIVELAR